MISPTGVMFSHCLLPSSATIAMSHVAPLVATASVHAGEIRRAEFGRVVCALAGSPLCAGQLVMWTEDGRVVQVSV